MTILAPRGRVHLLDQGAWGLRRRRQVPVGYAPPAARRLPKTLALVILVNAISEVPIELDEAAKVDGASTPQILRKVIWPVVRPALLTTFIFGFMLEEAHINPNIPGRDGARCASRAAEVRLRPWHPAALWSAPHPPPWHLP